MILDTRQVGAAERPDFARYCLSANFLPIDLLWLGEPATARAHAVVSDVGALRLCSGSTNAVRVRRTPRLAGDGTEPSVIVMVQAKGATAVTQGNRDAILTPGALVIYASNDPFTLINEAGMTGDFFRIPLSLFALPHDAIRSVTATSLCPGHPLTALTHDHLRRVASDPDLCQSADVELISRPSVDLIEAVIATHRRDRRLASDPLASTLSLRILDYARRNLSDPDLTAERIAAAHYVSVRQLYKVLASANVSLADWIRAGRLEACKAELAGNPWGRSIAAVAARHGFVNASSFSRAFRNAYGRSPRDWRAGHADRSTELRRRPNSTPEVGPGPVRGRSRGGEIDPDPAPAPATMPDSVPLSAHPLDATIRWMRENAASTIDLPAIANHAAVSPRTLDRRFRAHLGTTPLRFLNGIRVELAKELLATTDHTVDRVAQQCGFGSYSSLHYHFTRLAAMSPDHYRRHFGAPVAPPDAAGPRPD